jgi:hypothetical protein
VLLKNTSGFISRALHCCIICTIHDARIYTLYTEVSKAILPYIHIYRMLRARNYKSQYSTRSNNATISRHAVVEHNMFYGYKIAIVYKIGVLTSERTRCSLFPPGHDACDTTRFAPDRVKFAPFYLSHSISLSFSFTCSSFRSFIFICFSFSHKSPSLRPST